MNLHEGRELKNLLRRLQEEDTNFRVFGSAGHKYQLRPTLTESQLRAFEQKHQIKLPEDYRSFLGDIGNGGAGPYYGLSSLEQAAQHRDLSKPFPFIESTEDIAFEELEKLNAFDQYQEYVGVLEACHEGCAIYTFLVVNGPAYGTMWDGREDCYPTGLTFDAWYQQWVEMLETRALPVLKNERKVENVKAGTTKKEVISIMNEQWREADVMGTPTLIFENLATKFELDDTKMVITRRIDYSIV